jgi:hypothetical protein
MSKRKPPLNTAKPHKPNTVSRTDRVLSLALGLVLTGYGLAGFLLHRLSFNSRRIRVTILEGGPAWLMAAALLVGAAVLFSVVIDHYDARDNERYYKAFRWCAIRLGWCLVASALLAHLYIGFTHHPH